MKERVDREMDIVRALKKYDDGNHSKGETLSDEQRVYRIRVGEKFHTPTLNTFSSCYFLITPSLKFYGKSKQGCQL